MPTLAVVDFNIVCATLGGFITLFGLVSYLLKEKYYLSEALISTIAGLILSPHAANFIKPLQYANDNPIDLETVTLYFTRLVLGVQLVLAGVQLPSKYLWTERKSLAILLGPGMCAMWMCTSLLIWALVPNISFLFALSVAACVTPTDPVLSNSIVKGKFADKNIPPPLQKIIIAESGANDGLGYPFLFLGLYLIKYTDEHGLGVEGGAGEAMRLWFGETWAYTILLSVVYGAVVGWVAKELLHWAEERRYVDRESFLVFAITLALFIVGTVGMIGSDDVLACFIAGNAFTWDDWFRLETQDDSLQPTIDMLLNVAVFMWFGAVCPWHKFVSNDVIPIYRLIPLGILVLLLRRLPMILTFHKKIREIVEIRQALFVGFFGPIGVSAIFYLYISREFLRGIEVDGLEREDAYRLGEVMDVVIWFLAVCSIVVHGLSIPVGKLGFHLPRTISTAISAERRSRSPSTVRAGPQGRSGERSLTRSFRRRRPTTSELGPAKVQEGNSVSRYTLGLRYFGRSLFRLSSPRTDSQQHQEKDTEGDGPPRPVNTCAHPEISLPIDGHVIGRAIKEPLESDQEDRTGPNVDTIESSKASISDTNVSNSPTRPKLRNADPLREGVATPRDQPVGWNRSIRFPDETATGSTAEHSVGEWHKDTPGPDVHGAE